MFHGEAYSIDKEVTNVFPSQNSLMVQTALAKALCDNLKGTHSDSIK